MHAMTTNVPSIPKVIHVVWVGNEDLCPHNCIQTWCDNHPGWELKLWDNRAWKETGWQNKRHMEQIAATGQLCGVADIMRWEILLNEGGVAIDADSISMMPLPEWIMTTDLFACYENERVKPGLISNGLVGTKPNNIVMRRLVEGFKAQKNIADRFIWYKLKRKRLSAWKTTGPMALTNALSDNNYHDASILPSHFSIPVHYSGAIYQGNGPVLCSQLYSGTGTPEYQALLNLKPKELVSRVNQQLGRVSENGA